MKERLKKLFTDAASDVADTFYPKGKSERRGEFIRDAGVLWVKISDNVDAYVKSKRKKPIALQVHMIVEDIIEHFTEEMHGMCSDDAYYELIDLTEGMLLGTVTKKNYVRHLEFVFGFEDSAEVATVRQRSEARLKLYRDTGHTTDDNVVNLDDLPDDVRKVIEENR